MSPARAAPGTGHQLKPRTRWPGSVVAQRLDQLALAHVGAAFDSDLLGPLVELLLVHIVILRRLAAAFGDFVAAFLGRRVSNARRLLLRSPLLSYLAIGVLVLDARVRHLMLLPAYGPLTNSRWVRIETVVSMATFHLFVAGPGPEWISDGEARNVGNRAARTRAPRNSPRPRRIPTRRLAPPRPRRSWRTVA